MEKEQLYQTIEAYLEGELSEEERIAFERELATDITLAKEVKLHRSLQQQLGDAPKMKLRQNLDAVAKEFPEPDLDLGKDTKPNMPDGDASGGVPFWWWGLGFFLIIAGGITWYLLTMTPEPVIVTPTESKEIAKEDPIQEEPAANTMDSPQEATNKPATTTDTKDPASTVNKRPQAFNTNRELELLIGEEPASRRYVFSDGTLNYLTQDNQSFLSYSGKLVTSRSVEEGFFLNLYTNQYPEGRVFREPLTFSEVNPDAPIAFAAKKEYIAAYTGETDLSPALYYGVVTQGDSSIPLWVGKVRVE